MFNFIVFDIVEFYPSITKEVFNKAVNWAASLVPISSQDKNVIFSAKKSLLYHRGEAWQKKGGGNFDVTMGSYDGAETADLVGLYLLSKLQHLGINLGLYRDDGLGYSTLSPRNTENAKKKICQVFAEYGFKVTTEVNLKSVDFLDIHLDLESDSYRPYMKPNGQPIYVHSESNHPPKIIQNIPLSINTRLSKLSKNEEIFKKKWI